MKFTFYDVLSHLIPGVIIYIFYLQIIGLSFESEFIVPATAFAFVIGYFVNTLSSWLEDFFYLTWGGKPSSCLLDGKDMWKVKFYEHQKARALLEREFGKKTTNNDALFSVAMRYATPGVNSRVGDFNANYAFSRVMLTTVLIASGFAFYMYYNHLMVYLCCIPLILVAWYRSKQRGYYFAREVLRTYLQVKTKTQDD